MSTPNSSSPPQSEPITITPTPQEPTILSALSTLSPKREYQRLTGGTMPCARTALLAGIATAAGTIGVGTVAGRGMYNHVEEWH